MQIGAMTLVTPQTDPPAVEAVPLCRDCAWCRPSWWLLVPWPIPFFRRAVWSDARCRHPTSLVQDSTVDYVAGERKQSWRMLCSSARTDRFRGDRCGVLARHFKPRRHQIWLVERIFLAIGPVLWLAWLAFVTSGFWWRR